jgi:hypothetical protein
MHFPLQITAAAAWIQYSHLKIEAQKVALRCPESSDYPVHCNTTVIYLLWKHENNRNVVCLVIPGVVLNLLADNFLLQEPEMFQKHSLCEIFCFFNTCKLLIKGLLCISLQYWNSEIYYHKAFVDKRNSNRHVENHKNNNKTFKD